MVSNAIVNHLSGVGGGLILTKGVDLFAEQGRGDQYVVVQTTNTLGEDITAVRHANINVRVVGWPIMDGSMIAGLVTDKILTMEGNTYVVVNDPRTETLQISNNSQTETYRIKSVVIRNWPTLYTAGDKVAFTVNLTVSYIVTFI